MVRPIAGEQIIGAEGVALDTIKHVMGYRPDYGAWLVKGCSLGRMLIVPDGYGAWKVL